MSKKKQFTLDRRRKIAETELAEYETEMASIDLAKAAAEYNLEASRDWHSGVFRLYGSVDSNTCVELEQMLSRWARLNEGSPITLYLYSPGGDMMAGWLLYDSLSTLRRQGHLVTIVVRGFAASMGAVLLQAADARVMGREALLMFHEASSLVGGKHSEIEDWQKFLKRINNRQYEVLAKRSKLSAKQIRDMAKRKDVWLDAKQAIEMGLVDSIG